MSLTPSDLKNQGNQYYSNQQSSLAIQSYSQAIQLIENNSHDDVPLYLLYSNRSAAHIQEKDFYNGYEDAKQSLNLQRNKNAKGFYRLSVCSYHLGYVDEAKRLIREAIDEHKQNVDDYNQLKLIIEKKEKCMKKWRKPTLTVKKSLNMLKSIIDKQGKYCHEIPSILYQIQYIFRAYFDKSKDQHLMNIDHEEVGSKLQKLAMKFNSKFNVPKILRNNPIFEDLILNEMPDVGSVRKAFIAQMNLPDDEQDKGLLEKALEDVAANEFSLFINNVLVSLIMNSSDENLSLRALKQVYRLTNNDLYRYSLGDSLSDAMETYIHSHPYKDLFLDELILNKGIEIFFYDYLEAPSKTCAANTIRNLTIDQWKQQSAKTIDFVLTKISKKIDDEDIQLIEPERSSWFEVGLRELFGMDHTERKDDFHLIVNVLTKIYLAFGRKPFLDRSSVDALYLFIEQNWFRQFDYDQNQSNVRFLLKGWTSMLKKWLKFDYSDRRQYIEQINQDSD
ncbi:unnamed protein product [Adineta ricciae]|uniref:Uncharacterized protein n=1 Tax=Adineta ricciae TaxID=249248 RepID=A0A815BCZ9_ADIRI|nr:unnamed protein product [Adineta ricciae]CAF1578775.1 unnamed protein product [Adineta ricciae]